DIRRDAPIVYDGGIDTGSSLLFYSASPVILLDQNPDSDFVVRKFGIGRDRFLTISEFVAFWNSAAPKVFITEESKLGGWRELLGISLAPVARCGTQVLLKNNTGESLFCTPSGSCLFPRHMEDVIIVGT